MALGEPHRTDAAASDPDAAPEGADAAPEDPDAAAEDAGAADEGAARRDTVPDSRLEIVPGLTPTGRVILGMIGFGRHTGYDIKQLVDRSTRHFWAASYGQIYPELRRLEEQGLVQSRPEPSGARARTVYTLTAAGEQALSEWLASDAELVYELRDEGMLKLFFSDVAPETRIETIREMRSLYERKHAQLCALEARAPKMRTGPGLTLQIGLGVSAWLIDWCERTERRLAAEGDGESAIERTGTNDSRSED
jgi:DNA-binding PadR family transcriptional regulator